MSVSDPLLKQLKGHIFKLRTDENAITDHHPTLQPFCETLEVIFQKGLKQSNSLFSNRKDYWNWVEQLTEGNGNGERINPIFTMVVSTVKTSGRVRSILGKGRHFLRLALQKKVVCFPIEHLAKNTKLLETWYDPRLSIIGDEILREILMSLLFEATEINFKLNTKNASFLDDTWILPIYKMFEFVPCDCLGIDVQLIDGRPVTVMVMPDSVASEDNKIEPGDVLDELLGESLRYIRKGKITNLLKQNQGFPVYLNVVKCRLQDGSIFPPILALFRQTGKDVSVLQNLIKEDDERQRSMRIPPHAQLPEDEYDEIPVHNADDKATYRVQYMGKLDIGFDGGVHKIEGAIAAVLETAKDVGENEKREMLMELGETDVIVQEYKDNDWKFQWKHSYTEISSCGRRTDFTQHFGYIAGETTCTLARQFVAYVFRARTDEESKTILCTIAQGFGRTHWYV